MKRKIIWWAVVLAWCFMIFFQSSLPGTDSGRESKAVVDAVNRVISTITGADKPFITELMIRKAAHFTEYFILGILIYNALSIKRASGRMLLFSCLLGFAYSVTDEFHQYFIPGRAMSALDISIDTCGVIAGALIIYCVNKTRGRLIRLSKDR